MEGPFYSVNDNTKPLADFYHSVREFEFRFWQAALPPIEVDFEQVCERFARETGKSSNKVGKYILAVTRMVEELPRLLGLLELHWHLDMDRLCAIDAALAKLGVDVDPKIMNYLDSELALYLTPTVQQQHLPSPGAIGRKIAHLIAQVEAALAAANDTSEPPFENAENHEDAQETADDKQVEGVEDETAGEANAGEAAAKEQRNHVRTFSITNNAAELALEASPDQVVAARQVIAAKAKELGVSDADAMLALLMGEEEANIKTTICLYVPKDTPGAAGFLPGVGWVSHEVVEKLWDTATFIDMETAKEMETPTYQPTPAIRRYVEGRDGVCIWPGCERPAEKCQLDHRHNFADGGATSPKNLFALCQHHHNVKTDRQAHYIVDPDTNVVYWLFVDGTWIVDEAAKGPLGTGAGNWRQTFGQKLLKRRRNAAAKKDEQDPQ